MFTIGQLAKRVGVRSSALRYYEAEGLLQPNGRSEAGYRLYAAAAEERLRLIQRAQRLGFSLADIRTLLAGWEAGDLSDEALLATAEKRYLALEKQVTQLLALQHELALFLQDLGGGEPAQTVEPADGDKQAGGHSHLLDELLARGGAAPLLQANTGAMLNWLLQRTNCMLTTTTARAALDKLRGQHMHIWQVGEAFHILVVSQETAVGNALQTLSQLEADCDAHNDPIPELTYDDEGYLLTVRGENAFILARLFLTLGVAV